MTDLAVASPKRSAPKPALPVDVAAPERPPYLMAAFVALGTLLLYGASDATYSSRAPRATNAAIRSGAPTAAVLDVGVRLPEPAAAARRAARAHAPVLGHHC